MNQFLNQQQLEVKKKKWNLKKISFLAGVSAVAITATSLSAWGITNHYAETKKAGDSVEINAVDLPLLTYEKMDSAKFDKLVQDFKSIDNFFIKSLATKQLLFYLPSNSFSKLAGEVIDNSLIPETESILKEKILNTVSSNLRVWGLSTGYQLDSNLARLDLKTLDFDSTDQDKISFEFNLGYANSNQSLEIKGKIADSGNNNVAVSKFNKENLAFVFNQANENFKWELNRQGYFIGLNFKGEKDENKNWLSDQTIDLQEFNSQVWDYALNSLKNFNLVKEDVFVNGLDLFKIEGWRSALSVNAKVDEDKNEIWIDKRSDFGAHSIVSKVQVSYKADENINFEFWGSYLQNDQWGNY